MSDAENLNTHTDSLSILTPIEDTQQGAEGEFDEYEDNSDEYGDNEDNEDNDESGQNTETESGDTSVETDIKYSDQDCIALIESVAEKDNTALGKVLRTVLSENFENTVAKQLIEQNKNILIELRRLIHDKDGAKDNGDQSKISEASDTGARDRMINGAFALRWPDSANGQAAEDAIKSLNRVSTDKNNPVLKKLQTIAKRPYSKNGKEKASKEKSPEQRAQLEGAKAEALELILDTKGLLDEFGSTGNKVINFKDWLDKSYNIILHGPPGTGKTWLAKNIAKAMVAETFELLHRKPTNSPELARWEADLKKAVEAQVGFVQFHPSYDYTDFVEGLRPSLNASTTASKHRQGNVGPSFSYRAGKFRKFIEKARLNYEEASKKGHKPSPYIFIIDEINRGEISKIFGELFYAIDPGNRGEDGKVETQYTEQPIYVPKNVYVIGTMNDIDRSVDTFDFAMHRRFRFIRITPLDNLGMLGKRISDDSHREKALKKMINLNRKIREYPEDGVTPLLGQDYELGGDYFAKSIVPDWQKLWEDYLKPLLESYLKGSYDSQALEEFEKAFEED